MVVATDGLFNWVGLGGQQGRDLLKKLYKQVGWGRVEVGTALFV